MWVPANEPSLLQEQPVLLTTEPPPQTFDLEMCIGFFILRLSFLLGHKSPFPPYIIFLKIGKNIVS